MLEELNQFLSSSTIHGLAHIPASQRLWRLFWILIVTAGFTVSSVLIWMSFSGWRESPISTTIAIKPITELRFPNITVCPPRNTATVLNYHLELAKAGSLSNQTRQELREYFYQNLLEIGYEEMWRNLSLHLEQDGLRKWYLGLSQITLPYFNTELDRMFYYYGTVAPSGEVTTPLFGQPWNITNFDRAYYYRVIFYKPWKDTARPISIVFQLEQDILTELTGQDEMDSLTWTFHKDETNITKETSMVNQQYYYIGMRRLISEEEAARIRREKMPGIRVSWHYNDSFIVENDYKEENRNFVRLVNILHHTSSLEEVWLAVREAKYLYIENISKYCKREMIKDSIVSEKLDFIEAKLGVTTMPEVEESVNDTTLTVAGEMMVHLVYCHSHRRIQSWLQLYPDLLTNYSAKALVMTLSRIASKVTELDNKFEFVLAKRMLRKVWEVLELPPLSTDMTDQKNIHHPVHLVDEEGKLSPSALIPFCDFGGDVSWLAEKVSEFDLAVCNSFRKTLLKGQLCYTLDVNQLRREKFTSEDFSLGLTLLLDYNEDRMISDNTYTRSGSGQRDVAENNLVKNIVDFEELHKAYINIDTLSMLKEHLFLTHIDFLAPIELYGEGHYALGNVKEIKVTSSYLNMDRAVTGCQNVESLVHCNNRKFRDQLQSTCNCFPPNLRDIFEEVGDGDGGHLSRSLDDKLRFF